jgi:hypothetical protein
LLAQLELNTASVHRNQVAISTSALVGITGAVPLVNIKGSSDSLRLGWLHDNAANATREFALTVTCKLVYPSGRSTRPRAAARRYSSTKPARTQTMSVYTEPTRRACSRNIVQ